MDPLASVALDRQFAAISDPHRLAILRLLMARSARLVDLGEAMGRHRAWVRHHLMRLVEVGLVELVDVRKVENWTEKWYPSSGSRAVTSIHSSSSPTMALAAAASWSDADPGKRF